MSPSESQLNVSLYIYVFLLPATQEKLLIWGGSTWIFGTLTLLTPNDHYSGRTAPLTSRRYILNIYSTNIRTEYFKYADNLSFSLFKTPFIS
jgi:hypothetical protein